MDGLAREGRHVGITTDGRAVLLVWSADRPGMLDDVVYLDGLCASLLPEARVERHTLFNSWLEERGTLKVLQSWHVGGLPEMPSLYPRLYRPEE